MINLTNFMPFPLGIIISIAILILSAISMEGVAWLLHRFVMHQFGWYLHEDHHRYTEGRFEKNDLFSVFFAVLSFILIFIGFFGENFLLWMGVGVALYGFGYFAFHDVLFHKRIKNSYRPKNGYMKRIFNAHSYHHQSTNAKGPGYSFGFLYASKKYKTLSKYVEET